MLLLRRRSGLHSYTRHYRLLHHMVRAPLIVTLCRNGDQPQVIHNGAFVVDTCCTPPKVIAMGSYDDISGRYPKCDEYTVYENKVVMPGQVNLHTHFYSALARGIALSNEGPTNFMQTLQRLWWRLDRVLDPTSVYASGVVGIMDGIRQGITTFFDHHASFTAIPNSLQRLADASRTLGVRSCLCYEVSDRQGPEAATAAIAENVRFAHFCHESGARDLAAMMGMHASFTVSDSTLDKCVSAERECGSCGFHVHVAEAEYDQTACINEYGGKRVVQRLVDSSTIDPNTDSLVILAHGTHLSAEEKSLVAAAREKCVIAHNPESNLNNAVGIKSVHDYKEAGIRVGVGSDGFTSGIWHSLRLSYLMPKHTAGDPGLMFDHTLALLHENGEVATSVFNRGVTSAEDVLSVGELGVNSVADWIAIPYDPPTPFNDNGVLMHLLFGIMEAHPTDVVSQNRVLLRDGAFVNNIDERAMMKMSREQARRVWAHFLEGRNYANHQTNEMVVMTDSTQSIAELMGEYASASGDNHDYTLNVVYNVADCRAMTSVPRSPVEVRERLSQSAQHLLDGMVKASNEAYAFHRATSDYTPSPLVSYPHVSSTLNVNAVLVKDESSSRWGLSSFKPLGSSFALRQALKQREAQAKPGQPARKLTVITATDGNHGCAVAWCANQHANVVSECIIYVPALPTCIAPARIKAIEAHGARVVVVDGDYDDAVTHASTQAEQCASDEDIILLSDTGISGVIPRDVMAGYMTLYREALEQCTTVEPPTHVFIQAGIGGLACAGVSQLLSESSSPDAVLPCIVVVEPASADGCLQACRYGTIDFELAANDSHMKLDSMMQGLNSAVPSTIAWPLLKEGVDAYIGIGDAWSAAAMRTMYLADDRQVVAGESGAASFGGVLACLHNPHVREQLDVTSESVILCVNSEGATDPEGYDRIVPEANITRTSKK